MKILLKLVVYTLLAVLGGIIVLHLWPDEELKPEAATWMQPAPNPVAPEQNAYFSLFGFNAPADQDPYALGQAKAQAVTQSVLDYRLSGKTDSYVEPEIAAENQPDAMKLDLLCKWETDDCLAAYRNNPAPLQELLVSQQRWLDRYRSLYQRPHFHDPVPMTSFTPMPNFGQIIKLQRLLQAGLAAQFDRGERAGALAGLRQDLVYSRMLLAEANTLFGKMVAARMIANTLQVYSGLLEAAEPGAELLAEIAALEPLKPAELALETALRAEFRGVAEMYVVLPTSLVASLDQPGLLQEFALKAMPFKVRATINRAYASYARFVPLGSLGYAEGKALRQQQPPAPEWWEWLYNSQGTILDAVAMPDLGNFGLRLHELNGMIALVKLKAQLRAGNIQASGLAAFDSPHKIHPYTGNPVQWEAQRRVLRYAPADYLSQPVYSELRVGAWLGQ